MLTLIGLSLEPLIGALAAGNAVVLKPSELAPECSSLLANAIPRYLDFKAVKVIQGGPGTGERLLHWKWDKIFFTGSILHYLKNLSSNIHVSPKAVQRLVWHFFGF